MLAMILEKRDADLPKKTNTLTKMAITAGFLLQKRTYKAAI